MLVQFPASAALALSGKWPRMRYDISVEGSRPRPGATVQTRRATAHVITEDDLDAPYVAAAALLPLSALALGIYRGELFRMTAWIPTDAVLAKLKQQGLTWQELVAELDKAERITPIAGEDGKGRRYTTCKIDAHVSPGKYLGEDVMFVNKLWGKMHQEAGDASGILGVEPQAKKSGRKGGSGNRWPTDFKELVKRIRLIQGCDVRQGGKHLLIMKEERQVGALPLTASDHRSLQNACLQLKKLGIDVSR